MAPSRGCESSGKTVSLTGQASMQAGVSNVRKLPRQDPAWQLACDCIKSGSEVTFESEGGPELVLHIWKSTAQAISKELDAGRCVVLPGLGTFFLQPLQKKRESVFKFDVKPESLIPFFAASEEFMDKHGLQCDRLPEPSLASGPKATYSVAQAARAADVTKETAQGALTAFIAHMGHVMAASPAGFSLSFAPLGTFVCKDKIVSFEPQPRQHEGGQLLSQGFEPTISMLEHGGSPGHKQPSTKVAPTIADAQSRVVHGTEAQATVPMPLKPTPPVVPLMSARRRPHPEGQFSASMHKSLPHEDLQYPPLLNECSRTQAVPFAVDEPASASNRIAASYAGQAAWLSAKPCGLPSRSLRWRPAEREIRFPVQPQSGINYGALFPDLKIVEGSSMDYEIAEAGMSHSRFYEVLHRYNYYVSQCVPISALAPYPAESEQKIIELIDCDRLVRGLPGATIRSMLSEMQEEVLQDYHHSLQRAVVNHVLLDEQGRKRTGVPIIPCPVMPWGSVPFVGVEGTHGGIPKEWPETVYEKRMKMEAPLSTCAVASQQLLDLWHRKYDSLLLVDCPPEGAPPLHDLQGFCDTQFAQCNRVCQLLETEWLSEAAWILAKTPNPVGAPTSGNFVETPNTELADPNNSKGSVDAVCENMQEHPYEAAATLLSTQVRGVVERSIRTFVSFFRRFRAESRSCSTAEGCALTSGSAASEDSQVQDEAFLRISLQAKDGDIFFTTPLEQVEDSLVNIFREFVVSLRGLQRPDVKLETWSGRGRSTLWDVSLEEGHVKEAEELIATTIRRNLETLVQALSIYDEFKHLLIEEVRVKKLSEDLNLTREDYTREVDRLRSTEAAIRTKCANEIRLQMVIIDCTTINDALCKKADEAVKILLEAVLRNLLSRNDQLCKSFKMVVNQMVKKPTSEMELVDLEAHVEEFRSNGLSKLLAEFSSIREWLSFLFDCEDRLRTAFLEQRHFHAIYDSAWWVNTIDQTVAEREANLSREREALESKFKEQRNKFLEDMDGFNALVEQFQECGNIRQVDEYLERIQALKSSFARAYAEAEKLNAKEARFGWDPSPFEQLKRGQQALEPHHQLWTLAYNQERGMRLWLKGPLFQLEPAKLEIEVKAMRKEATRLREVFLLGGGHALQEDQQEKNVENVFDTDSNNGGDNKRADPGGVPAPVAVAEQLEGQVGLMQDEHLGLVYALCNTCLQTRHWEQISNLVGFVMEPDNTFTLSKAIELEMGRHRAQLQEMSEAATKEHAIEVALDAMEADWEPVTLELELWRQTGTCVIVRGCVDEMRGVVDDHLVKTRTMRSSPHVKAWAVRLQDWEAWLESMGEILERWITLQTQWTYLEPVFTLRDILRQMPAEAQLFRKADIVWHGLVQAAKETPSAFEVSKLPGLLEKLTEACKCLEQVQKGMADYLESKRISFPRFFLLSNNKLLETLVDVKDPVRLQPHLRLVFPGIHSLIVPQSMSMGQSVMMVSGSGGTMESVALDQAPDSSVFEGALEEWFCVLEQCMVSAMRYSCLQALHFRASHPRSDWLIRTQPMDGDFAQATLCPFQAAVCTCDVLRTQEMSMAIIDNSLPSLGHRLIEDLNDLLALVDGQQLRPGAMHLLQVLIALDLRCRDAVQRMVTGAVTTEDDFDWLSQMRYYVEGGPADVGAMDDSFKVVLAAGTSRHNFQYEYLGCSPRIVVTPLTERVFLSLCTSMDLHYMSAVEGVSGSGKTETVKDLAKAMAAMCFIFVCTQSFDIQAANRFLRGCTSSGAWLCLEGLQAADAVVLSVMAQQVFTIQQALIRQSVYYDFEGTTIRLRGGLLSMTLPLMAWREMPVALTLLVRPIAMVVPDVEHIITVRLLGFGFKAAEQLARRLALVLRQAKELHGPSDEYDLSLHAVRIVLSMLRRHRKSEEGEMMQLYSAMMQLRVHSLRSSSVKTWQEFLKNMFEDCDIETAPSKPTRHVALGLAVREQLSFAGISHTSYLESKAAQLYEALLSQTGVLAIGQTLSGKTASLKFLAAALTAQASIEGPGRSPNPNAPANAQLLSLVPGCLTAEELFRSTAGPAGEETLGTLATLLVRPTSHTQQLEPPPLTSSYSSRPSIRSEKLSPSSSLVPGNSRGEGSSRSFSGRSGGKRSTAKSLVVQTSRESNWGGDCGDSVVGMGANLGLVMSYQELAALEKQYNNDFAEDEEAFIRTLAPRCWLHLDGDLDPCWAEMMHPLLDGEFGACLQNGEVISPPSNFGMVFESTDVANASPGTIGRLTPIYFAAGILRTQDVIETYLTNHCSSFLQQDEIKRAVHLSSALVPTLLKFLSDSSVPLLVRADQNNLVQNFLNVLTLVIYPASETEQATQLRSGGELATCLDAWVLQACIWGLGSLLADEAARRRFHDEFNRLLRGEPAMDGTLPPRFDLSCKLLDDDHLCFDLGWDVESLDWLPWMEHFSDEQSFDGKAELVVRTAAMASATQLATLGCKARTQVLMCGPRNCGKTVYMQNVSNSLKITQFRQIIFSFNELTTASDLQDAIDVRLEKRGRNSFGPPAGAACAFFIDDLSLPAVCARQDRRRLRSQPLELLRQFCNYGGWYDRLDPAHSFKSLQDCFAHGTLSSQRAREDQVSARLLRYFYILGVLPDSIDSLAEAFDTLLRWRYINDFFLDEVVEVTEDLARASLEVVQQVSKILPLTPSKPLSSVGVTQAAQIVHSLMNIGLVADDCELEKMVRLFVHESLRVLADRCGTEADMERVTRGVGLAIEQFDVLADGLPLLRSGILFTDLLAPAEDGEMTYDEVEDNERLHNVIEMGIDDFCEDSKQPKEIILNDAAIEHILRISRALRPDGGSALVVGSHQSGRRSLSRIAMWMSGFAIREPVSLFEPSASGIDLKAWRKEVKDTIHEAGAKNADSPALLCSDTEIGQEDICSDLSSLVALGHVPHLWEQDDMGRILDVVRDLDPLREGADVESSEEEEDEHSDVKRGNEARIDTLCATYCYGRRCHTQLKVVLCISPSGDLLRVRLRQFPVLLKHCTVDWFRPWPSEALTTIAQKCMAYLEVSKELSPSCTGMCNHIHDSVVSLCQRWYKSEDWRHQYHTSLTSFLELIGVFLRMLTASKKQLEKMKHRYEKGLQGLSTLDKQLLQLREAAESFGPLVDDKNAEISDIMKDIEDQEAVTARTRDILEVEQEVANASYQRLAAMKSECDTEIGNAKGRISDVESDIEGITVSDLLEIKTMRNPSNTVKKVLEIMCVMKGQKFTRVRENSGGGLLNDSWTASQKLLSDSSFLEWILEYDKDRLPQSIIKIVSKMLLDEDVEASKVQQSPEVINSFYSWVLALLGYHTMQKTLKPKQQALEVAEEEYGEIKAKLEVLANQYQIATDELQQHQQRLAEQRAVMDSLTAQRQETEGHITRVGKLLNDLGSERSLWEQQVNEISGRLSRSSGDALIAAGIVVHLGAFPWQDRADVMISWEQRLQQLEIQCTHGFSLHGFIRDVVNLEEWSAAGLPQDAANMQGAAIVSISRRCTLCIDPQGYASRWLKNMEEPHKLCVVRGGSPEHIIQAASAGVGVVCQPILIEGLQGSSLGISLGTLLTKLKEIQLSPARKGKTASATEKTRLYITTRTEHFSLAAEASHWVTVVDFSATTECIQGQMLHALLTSLVPEQASKQRLQQSISRCDSEFAASEDKLIELVSVHEGSVLETEEVLQSLENTKASQLQLAVEKVASEVQLQNIDELKTPLLKLASSAVSLYMTLTKLSALNPMYCYSLSEAIEIFHRCCTSVAVCSDGMSKVCQEGKAQSVPQLFAAELYHMVLPSLLSQHRRLFPVLLAMELQQSRPEGENVTKLVRFITEASTMCASKREQLAQNQGFEQIAKSLEREPELWREALSSQALELAVLPDPFGSLSHLERILALSYSNPERCPQQLERWALQVLGLQSSQSVLAAQGQEPDLMAALLASSSTCPVILLILTSVFDPMIELPRLAEQQFAELHSLSMGRDNGFQAEPTLNDARRCGHWVLLQNCHLEPIWLPKLASLCDEFTLVPGHRNFRLWLSSRPCATFPSSVLASSVKVACELPQGLKSNLSRLLKLPPISEVDFFEGCPDHNAVWKGHIYLLLCAHAALLGRQRHGDQGGLMPYHFVDTDLLVSVRQLQLYMASYSSPTPQKMIQNCVLGCHYGGRIIDPQDQLFLAMLLEGCTEAETKQRGVVGQLSSMSADYTQPSDLTYQRLMEAVDKMPDSEPVVLLGLPAGVGLLDARKCSAQFFQDLSLEASASCSLMQAEPWAKAADIASRELAKLPDSLPKEAAFSRFAKPASEGPFYALLQDVKRYDRLLTAIVESLSCVVGACQGTLVLTENIECDTKSLVQNKTPEAWKQWSYLCVKPLQSYLMNLAERFAFMRRWIDEGAPATLWMPGLFTPRAFCVASMQALAASQGLLIDVIELHTHVVDREHIATNGVWPRKPPDSGFYARGLFLESCIWDSVHGKLAEPETGACCLPQPCPLIWLKPRQVNPDKVDASYECPAYSIQCRQQAPQHSLPNFVCRLRLPPGEDGVAHWLRRGARAVLQVDT